MNSQNLSYIVLNAGCKISSSQSGNKYINYWVRQTTNQWQCSAPFHSDPLVGHPASLVVAIACGCQCKHWCFKGFCCQNLPL